jgi:hypothetical protein
MSILCSFELNGACNDDTCRFQHARDYKLPPSAVASDLSGYLHDLDPTSKPDVSDVSSVLPAIHQSSSAAALVASLLATRSSQVSGTFAMRRFSAVPKKQENKLPLPQPKDADQDALVDLSLLPSSSELDMDDDEVETHTTRAQVHPSALEATAIDSIASQADYLNVHGSRLPGFDAVFEAGEPDAGNRYFGSDASTNASSVQHLETLLKANPQQPDIWLRYISVMTTNSTPTPLALLNQKLSLLVAALEANQDNEDLWLAYLTCFSEKAPVDQCRALLSEALARVPHSVALWRRAVASCTSVVAQKDMFIQALNACVSHIRSQPVVSNRDSHAIVDFVLQFVSFATDTPLSMDPTAVLFECFQKSLDSPPYSYRGLALYLPRRYQSVLAASLLMVVVHRICPQDPWLVAAPDTAFVLQVYLMRS